MRLEVIYVAENSDDRHLQLDRYLPATPIRCLIDPGMNKTWLQKWLSIHCTFSYNPSKALKAVNPNVRDEEIEHLKTRAAMGHQCLQSVMLRLDSLRLMIAG